MVVDGTALRSNEDKQAEVLQATRKDLGKVRNREAEAFEA